MKKTKAFLALMVMCTLIFELCVPVAGAFAMDGANMHADIVHNFDLQSVVRTQTGTAPVSYTHLDVYKRQSGSSKS